MFNPLSPDLSEMSLDDLTKRVSDLHKRLAHARQFQRQETITQTGIMLQEAEYELAKRSREMYKQKLEPETPEDEPKEDKPNLDVGE